MPLNKDRAMEKMQQYSFDALIATYPENVKYITDLQSHSATMYRFFGRYNHAVIGAREGFPSALIISPNDAGFVAAYPPTVDEIYTSGHGRYRIHEGVMLSKVQQKIIALLDQKEKYGVTVGDALVKCLKDRGIIRGKVGLEEKVMEPATRNRLITELPNVEFVDAFDLFRVIRMVKTPEEIERLKQAASINENALYAVMEHFRTGITEEELLKVFRCTTVEQGAILNFINANNGRRVSYSMLSSGGFDPPSSYRVQKGDLYKFDCGSKYRHYFSDTGHCFLAGESNQYVEKIHQVIKTAMDSVFEIIRPGVKPSAIFAKVVEVMAQGGIKNYGPHCGHGIGIECRDYPLFQNPAKSDCPYFPGSTDFPLEANMVINIEIPYYELGYGAWQMEHSFLITKNGFELLIPQNRELWVL